MNNINIPRFPIINEANIIDRKRFSFKREDNNFSLIIFINGILVNANKNLSHPYCYKIIEDNSTLFAVFEDELDVGDEVTYICFSKSDGIIDDSDIDIIGKNWQYNKLIEFSK